MCRVFCDNRARSQEQLAMGFELPTRQPVGDWSSQMVAKWLHSWRVAEGRDAGEEDGPNTLASQEEKDVAWMTLRTLSGQQLLEWDLEDMQYHIRKSVERECPGQGQAMAQKLAAKLVAMRDKLVDAMAKDTRVNSVPRSLDQDQRILACADSNNAVDNLLRLLDGDLDFMAQGYTVVRLGNSSTVAEPRLLKYSLEEQVKAHRLTRIYEDVMETLEKPGSTYENQRSKIEMLCEALRLEKESLKQEAEAELSESLKKMLIELADSVIESAMTKVKANFEIFVKSKPRSKDRLATLRKLTDVLREEVKDLASYRLTISAQVVLATNTAAGELRSVCVKLGITFPILFLDESGQATESSSMIPLTLGPEWVLMGADLNQLPPTIKNEVARENFGYYGMSGGSLYGRLVHDLGMEQHTLHIQYRMHPKIRQFVGDTWYPHISPPLQEPEGYDMIQERPLPCPQGASSNFRWPNPDTPVAFLDVSDGFEKMPANSRSYVNLKEASLSVKLALILASDPTLKSIAILSSYKAQASMISNKLKKCEAVLQHLADRGRYHLKQLDAYTVDGFQGREADVVILSPVRSNGRTGSIGHTGDFRRLNVAISRAKRALVVVGNVLTLTSDSKVSLNRSGETVKNYWRDFVLWANKNGAVVTGHSMEQILGRGTDLPSEIVDFEDSDTGVRDMPTRPLRLSDMFTAEVQSWLHGGENI
eukprot:CAMPEP_0177606568 /NCGR_PEP_ID=MMETSP0419_2-20121207/17379_1 /TAXON_ID=582737 /ORGANISM="Tetraselmis sp., Strain GSL018" /LENGTH=706 /DNA_ID=CAMNT_0019100943 /DNA_START=246 /DNA_END=2366 /DNA_ORIENTATION=-